MSGFKERTIKIGYWNAHKQVVAASLLALESKLAALGSVEVVVVQDLSEIDDTFDLQIVVGPAISEKDFGSWLIGMQKRVQLERKVWIPAIILTEISFGTLDELMNESVQSNWYFDIISANHLESLPIRVANLVRIHDHLHELKRYDEQLQRLDQEVQSLQSKINL